MINIFCFRDVQRGHDHPGIQGAVQGARHRTFLRVPGSSRKLGSHKFVYSKLKKTLVRIKLVLPQVAHLRMRKK